MSLRMYTLDAHQFERWDAEGWSGVFYRLAIAMFLERCARGVQWVVSAPDGETLTADTRLIDTGNEDEPWWLEVTPDSFGHYVKRAEAKSACRAARLYARFGGWMNPEEALIMAHNVRWRSIRYVDWAFEQHSEWAKRHERDSAVRQPSEALMRRHNRDAEKDVSTER